MTVTTTLDRQYFDGDGSNVNFPFNFRFFSNDQIVVTLIGDDGSITPQTITTHYTVTGAGSAVGGTVVMVTAPSSIQTLLVQRVVPLDQPASIRNQGAFFPQIHENVFDRMIMQIQQVAGRIGRTLVFPASDPTTSNPTLPPSVSRAGHVLAFDPTTGDPIVSNLTLAALEQQPTNAAASAAAAAASETASGNSATASGNSAAASAASATLANKWAENPEDVPVTAGLFSAHHWANKAAAALAGLTARVVTLETQKTTLVAAQSASGTAVNFNSIPSWVNRIVITIDGVSTSGSSIVQVQLGTAASFEVTGYVGGVDTIVSSGGVPAAFTTGLALERAGAPAASQSRYGVVTLIRSSANGWLMSGSNFNDVLATGLSNARKVLADVLTRVRITTVNGTDTFDAGQFSVLMD